MGDSRLRDSRTTRSKKETRHVPVNRKGGEGSDARKERSMHDEVYHL